MSRREVFTSDTPLAGATALALVPALAASAVEAADPVAAPAQATCNLDVELIAAGAAWRDAAAVACEARARHHDARRAYRDIVGPCPPELGLAWGRRNLYLRAVGLQPGTISCGGKRPMPSWDPGFPDDDALSWGKEVHTAATLSTAIKLAPRNLGRAGTTPKLIRHWRELLPIAAARDAVRRRSEEAAGVQQAHDALNAAEDRLKVARDLAVSLPATTFQGLVVKARLAEFDMLEFHDGPDRLRAGMMRTVLAVFDGVLATGGGTMPMPPFVSRYGGN